MYKNIIARPVVDGGNPRYDHEITVANNNVHIFPFSEDGDGNYKFHMNVELINNFNEDINVDFTVDWGDLNYQSSRTHLLVCSNDDTWSYIDIIVEGTKVKGKAAIKPGISYLSFHPRYEHERLIRLMNGLKEDIFRTTIIGKTRRNRDIYALEAGNKDMRPIAFYGRVHPYETVGSYFMEGMIKWLSDKSIETEKFLSEYRVIFVPMPNTDGVADGTNKLTHGGLNFSTNFRFSVEPEAIALKEYFAANRPCVIYDIHGWNLPCDNMVTNDPEKGKSVYRELIDQEELFHKPLEILYRKYPRAGQMHSCAFFADELECSFFNTSWNHVGRTSKELYEMGASILRAVASSTKV